MFDVLFALLGDSPKKTAGRNAQYTPRFSQLCTGWTPKNIELRTGRARKPRKNAELREFGASFFPGVGRALISRFLLTGRSLAQRREDARA
jgi:hypothetical protein